MAEDTGHRDSRNKREYLLLSLVLCFHCVAKASTTIITNGVSPALSWWEARDHCKNKYNGDLYIPEHWQRLNGLQLDTYYWLGAFETLEWKWTDNSPLFQYIGYKKKFGLYPSSDSELLGNSVALCYSRCFPKNYIGLSDTRCYCLDYYQVSHSLSWKADQYQCPGNLAEKCGDASGMSVYKTDIKVWNTETGQCVYAYRGYNYQWKGYQQRFQAGSCNRNRNAVCSKKDARDWIYGCNGNNFYNRCSNRMCITCGRPQWISITHVCHLVNVTNANKRNMFRIIFQNTPYWIGLHRATKKMWINGRAVDNEQYHSKLNRTCLALVYRGDNWETGWVSCSEAFQGLCVNYNDPIETTTTIEEGRSRFPPTTHVVSTESTTTLVLGKTSGPLPTSTANNAIATTDGQQETERMLKGETKEVNNYGLYIGTGLGVLLLAVLITTVIVVMKRKEKFCFKKEHQTVVRFHAGTENLTYGSSPPRELAPSYMSLECVDPSVSPIAGPTQPDIVSDMYIKVDNSQRKNAEVNHSQERKKKSNVNSNKGFDDQDVYSRAGPCKKLKVDDNCYNHLNTDGDNDYDIAGLKPEIDRWDSTYNHLDAIRVDKEGNNEQDKQGDTDGENDYDIAGRKPETDRWDSTYNHLDAIRDKEESNEQEKGEDTDYYNIESTANRK